MPPITDPAIKTAAKTAASTGKPVRLKDPEQRGLELRVWPGGSRMWTLQCRDAAGRPRRFTLGQHPALGLAKAREACRTMREQVRQGADPTAAARQKRGAAKQAQGDQKMLSSLLDIYA